MIIHALFRYLVKKLSQTFIQICIMLITIAKDFKIMGLFKNVDAKSVFESSAKILPKKLFFQKYK